MILKKNKRMITEDEQFWIDLLNADGEENCRKDTENEGKRNSIHMSILSMIGYGFLICIPVIGLVSGIILALRRNSPARSDFAIACLFLRLSLLIGAFLTVWAILGLVYAASMFFAGGKYGK